MEAVPAVPGPLRSKQHQTATKEHPEAELVGLRDRVTWFPFEGVHEEDYSGSRGAAYGGCTPDEKRERERRPEKITFVMGGLD